MLMPRTLSSVAQSPLHSLQVQEHKTFHRYTVRARRGTAQGLRDAQTPGSAPRSAGASLRRYNEAALLKVRMHHWHLTGRVALAASDRWYHTAAGGHGRGGGLWKRGRAQLRLLSSGFVPAPELC